MRKVMKKDVTPLVFETHATSVDNEAGLASGHFDVDLSAAGERQAADMGRRYASNLPSLVVTSDSRRAWRTAEIAFGDRVRCVRDARLRECDYGDLTRAPVADIDARRRDAITVPFPGGESYTQVTTRVAEWLDELKTAPIDGWVLVIGHRATHYALDELLLGIPVSVSIDTPFTWQPGWSYIVR